MQNHKQGALFLHSSAMLLLFSASVLLLLQGAHCISDVDAAADGKVVAAATATQSNLNGMFLVSITMSSSLELVRQKH